MFVSFIVLHTNGIYECAAKRVLVIQHCSLLQLLTLFLSFKDFRLLRFSLAGFNSFLSSYRFILSVVLLQELTVFSPQIKVFLLCLQV